MIDKETVKQYIGVDNNRHYHIEFLEFLKRYDNFGVLSDDFKFDVGYPPAFTMNFLTMMPISENDIIVESKNITCINSTKEDSTVEEIVLFINSKDIKWENIGKLWTAYIRLHIGHSRKRFICSLSRNSYKLQHVHDSVTNEDWSLIYIRIPRYIIKFMKDV